MGLIQKLKPTDTYNDIGFDRTYQNPNTNNDICDKNSWCYGEIVDYFNNK